MFLENQFHKLVALAADEFASEHFAAVHKRGIVVLIHHLDDRVVDDEV